MKVLIERFKRLSPEVQQRIVWAGSLIGIFSIIVLVAATVPEPKVRDDRKAIARHLLTDADPRALGIDGLAAEIRELRKTQGEALQRLRTLEEKKSGSDATAGAPSNEPIKEEMAQLRLELEEMKKNEAKSPSVNPPIDIFPPLPETRPKGTLKRSGDFDALFPGMGQKDQGQGTLTAKTIRVIRGPEEKKGSEGFVTRPKTKDGIFIPAGSIIAGYLLNGLDAPTGNHARKEPFPVLVRVKEEAILPNRFKADVRECFLIASGYGDLSSERAYIRAEIFSCIRNDGGVIEVPMDAYAVGEDGKLGLRGRLIDKQGQLVAQSLAAGFAQGFSTLFNRIQVPVIMNGGQGALSSNVPFQSAFSAEASEGAVLKGTGAALDRLANYYMDMAENLFPVIEIDVTRRIEFVVQRGSELRIGIDRKRLSPLDAK